MKANVVGKHLSTTPSIDKTRGGYEKRLYFFVGDGRSAEIQHWTSELMGPDTSHGNYCLANEVIGQHENLVRVKFSPHRDNVI